MELDLSTGEPEVVAEGFQDIAVSVDGSRAAVLSRLDPTGQNGDGNAEVFLLDLAAGTYLQITDTLQASCGGLSPRSVRRTSTPGSTPTARRSPSSRTTTWTTAVPPRPMAACSSTTCRPTL